MINRNVLPLRPLRPFPFIAGLMANWYDECYLPNPHQKYSRCLRRNPRDKHKMTLGGALADRHGLPIFG